MISMLYIFCYSAYVFISEMRLPFTTFSLVRLPLKLSINKKNDKETKAKNTEPVAGKTFSHIMLKNVYPKI